MATTKTRKNDKLFQELETRLKKKTAKIGVIGLGYVGLPLAMELAREGFKVLGLDVSAEKVKKLNAGYSEVDDVPDGAIHQAVSAGTFSATTDVTIIGEMDVISICVPTPLSKTKDPDVSYILDAVTAIRDNMRKGSLIVLESTTYPGTTEDLILPLLEESGMTVGEDFFLAFSPERVDPGNAVYNTKNTPRVVGGITDKCTRVAKLFYEQTIPNIHPMTSTRAAEMVKLLENTFRSVNIGLVNEVALMCDRLDLNVWEIIDAAATKPFGFMPFYPGPGLGGHCIPIDPHYLSWKLKSLNYSARFIELAGDINTRMPEYVVERIIRLLNQKFAKALNRSTVLVLGVAYKKNIKDMRESPALDVIKLLEDRGARVIYNDPHVPEFEWNSIKHKSNKLTANLLKKADLTVVLTDHSAYDYDFVVEHSQAVFDTRNATKSLRKGRSKIEVL